METKHTPGPWEAVDCEVSTVSKPYDVICITSSDEESREENEANARLIAAAPSLLEALHSCLTHLDLIAREHGHKHSNFIAAEKARDAIASATGQPSPVSTD